jgi:hypothetical protein
MMTTARQPNPNSRFFFGVGEVVGVASAIFSPSCQKDFMVDKQNLSGKRTGKQDPAGTLSI